MSDPTTETKPDKRNVLVLRAGPNASDGTFGMRISDDVKLELPRGEDVEVPKTLKYAAVNKQRGADFGKTIEKTVDVLQLITKAIRFGFIEWVNRPPVPKKKPKK
jgi:hypothetical protein